MKKQILFLPLIKVKKQKNFKILDDSFNFQFTNESTNSILEPRLDIENKSMSNNISEQTSSASINYVPQKMSWSKPF